jgi:hypothetical protein
MRTNRVQSGIGQVSSESTRQRGGRSDRCPLELIPISELSTSELSCGSSFTFIPTAVEKDLQGGEESEGNLAGFVVRSI